MGLTPRRLVIVRRDHLALYRYLSERLADVPCVEVILDRRRDAPPVEATPAAITGPEEDRRRPLVRRERERWATLGYRLADGTGEEISSPGVGSEVA